MKEKLKFSANGFSHIFLSYNTTTVLCHLILSGCPHCNECNLNISYFGHPHTILYFFVLSDNFREEPKCTLFTDVFYRMLTNFLYMETPF